MFIYFLFRKKKAEIEEKEKKRQEQKMEIFDSIIIEGRGPKKHQALNDLMNKLVRPYKLNGAKYNKFLDVICVAKEYFYIVYTQDNKTLNYTAKLSDESIPVDKIVFTKSTPFVTKIQLRTGSFTKNKFLIFNC